MRNPLSIEAFADWCEKQPADKEYDYWNCEECACAQYAAFLGMTGCWHDRAKGGFWWDVDLAAGRATPGSGATFAPRIGTFGALASSLREACNA